ncbi:RNA polymerase sigma-70 factor (ECF subfamily) [Arthrobacter sp. CAN_A2]|uniref:RNA polymerase sigma factor n=1 Tax=Arthrobacter sp. CAN_A2 TaxID=2787718 RepID=UPI0018EF44F7
MKRQHDDDPPQRPSSPGIEADLDADLTSLVETATTGQMIGRGPGTREELPGAQAGPPSSRPGPVPDGGMNGSAAVSLDDLDELTVVARAQDGDLHAFEWLISAYQGGVFRLAFRMLDDHAEAEDIVQETFIAAWRNLPNLSAPQAFIPWLYRTATNKCFDQLRSRLRRPSDPVSFDDGASDTPGATGEGELWNHLPMLTGGPAQDPAAYHEAEAQMQALADLLQTVPASLRACWLLRGVHDFSYAEIAAIVQQPESTVRGRIARARRLLAEGMQPWR